MEWRFGWSSRPSGAAAFVLLSVMTVACAKPHLCQEGALTDCGKQCEALHPGSCERLGQLLEAKGPSSDPTRAFEAYRTACNGELFSACWRAGKMASRGDGTKRDEELASRLFRRACELGGEAEGCYGLGAAYMRGEGQQKDDKLAAETLKLACDKGHGHACGLLAYMADDKRIPGVEPETATRWRQTACDDGAASSCCALGRAAADAKNEDRAIELYAKACKALPAAECCQELEEFDVSPETGKRMDRATADPGPNPASPEELEGVVRGANGFAIRLGKQLFAKPGNLVYSPASISLGAAMVYAGARGETEKQMTDTMGFVLAQDRFHATYATILARWAKDLRGKGTVLYVANRLFGQKGYRFEPAFVDTTGTRYGAPLHPLDFASAPDDSARFINGWVEGQTRKRITNIVPPGALPPNSRIALVNAIYFNGKWASPFLKSSTKDAPFRLSPAKTVSVPMMNGMMLRPYAKVGAVTVVELPYQSSECVMTLLVPDAADGLSALESALSERALDKWVKAVKPTYVRLSLPKFVIHEDVDLKHVLPAMGMTTLFTPDADLSGMASEKPLFIDAALHKAFVDVNEEGTEAAAATVFFGAGYGRGPDAIEVNVDRPFLFLIRDTATGVVLFAGRVADPTEQ